MLKHKSLQLKYLLIESILIAFSNTKNEIQVVSICLLQIK